MVQIPDNLNNWRSPQPTGFQLQQLGRGHRIRRVIRLNGEEAGTPLATERASCEAAGIEFHYINFFSSGAMEQVRALLLLGNCLVHCQHGRDRTGAAVGYHLRKLGWIVQQVRQHNGWGATYQDRTFTKHIQG